MRTMKKYSKKREIRNKIKRKTFRKKRMSTNKKHGGNEIIQIKDIPNDEDLKRRYDYANYLTGVNFYNMKNNDEIVKLKDEIIKKSFYDNNIHFFENIDENLKRVINDMNTEQMNVNDNEKWIACKNECENYCIKMMSYEIYSTAYMLRLLSNSVIGDTDNNKIFYSITSVNDINNILTGKWENDSKYFDIKIIDSNGREINNTNTTGRLIMGFGPSASGKTYCAKQIIELMTQVDMTFPKFFLTIDGGIYREQSYIYQKIIKTCKENNIAGLSNLVSASIFTTLKTIFSSNIIKKNMKKYLLSQKNQNNQKINLYVPDTIAGCAVKCKSLYQDYIDITGDENWIGLMIYQHKSGNECPYPEKYKCVGCEESGKSLEETEGKKYSSSAWSYSYKNGNNAILQAPNYRFRIHNSGGRKTNDIINTTIFEDLSVKPIINDQTSQFLKDLNWEYSEGKIKINSAFFNNTDVNIA